MHNVAVQVWVQVPLKAAQCLCDDIVEMSTDLRCSAESSECPPEAQDTWHWWISYYFTTVAVCLYITYRFTVQCFVLGSWAFYLWLVVSGYHLCRYLRTGIPSVDVLHKAETQSISRMYFIFNPVVLQCFENNVLKYVLLLRHTCCCYTVIYLLLLEILVYGP